MELDVELSCGHHVTVVSEVRGYFVKCPWCPEHQVVAVVSIDGRPV